MGMASKLAAIAAVNGGAPSGSPPYTKLSDKLKGIGVALGGGGGGGIVGYPGSWNSSDKHADVTLTRINSINTAHASNSSRNARGTIALSGWMAFNFYILATGITNSIYVGIAKAAESLTTYPGGSANSYGIFCQNGKLTLNNVETVLFGTSFTTGDYITVNYKNGSVFFAKNGTYPLSANPVTGANPHITGLTDGQWYPYGCSADRAESCQILPAVA